MAKKRKAKAAKKTGAKKAPEEEVANRPFTTVFGVA